MKAKSRESGFTLIELLVVVCIIGVLIGILLPAVLLVQEAADTSRCATNMQQLGVALHTYHDIFGGFPTDIDEPMFNTVPPTRQNVAGFRPRSFYMELLPYIEMSKLQQFLTTNPNPYVEHVQPVAAYQCPSRKTPERTWNADYAHALHPHACSQANYPLNDHRAHPEWGNVFSVMGGVYVQSVSLQHIGSRDGASNTLLLSHKGVNLIDYTTQMGSVSNDGAINADMHLWTNDYYWWTTGYLRHKRYPGSMGADGTDSNFRLASPHRASSPNLFTDGSVRSIKHESLGEVDLGVLWGWNDGQARTE